MYTNPTNVRELTPLLTSEAVSDSVIQSFINRAESVINNMIGKRYVIPVRKLTNLTGTISTTATSNTVNGTDTLFTSELFVGEYIYSSSTRESLRVTSITDDTTLTVSSNALYTNTDVNYFVLPQELVTASEYETAKLLLDHHLSKRAYNQDHEDFTNQYRSIAEALIKEIKKGDYYNNELTPQATAQNRSRLVYINSSNALRTQVNRSATTFSSGDFYL